MKREIETIIRNFIAQDLMKQHAKYVPLHEAFEFDSLDQTEIRMFLEEEYGLVLADAAHSEPFETIGQVVDFVHLQLAATVKA